MPAPVISCDTVESEDLDTRYLAGRLDPEVAEAFEQHYFGCDRCFELVERGLEVRAAFGPARARSARGWWPLAAAAGIALVAVGVWRFGAGRSGAAGETERGASDTVVVTLGSRAGAVTATWRRVPGAERYRVRLFTADGSLLIERDIADTSASVAVSELRHPLTEAYWKILALDALGHEVASSELRRAVLPAP